MESQAQLSQQHNLLPDRKPSNFNMPKRRIVPGHQPTCLQHRVNYNRGSARGRGPTRRRPTPLETQEKRQRQKHADHWQPFTRAQFPGVDSRQNLDGNQSNLSCICPLTRIPRIMCACTSGILGYIKRVESVPSHSG